MIEGGASAAGETVGQRPLLGSAQAGLRFDLARSRGDEAEPFVSLYSGRFARVLLARVVVDPDQTLLSFAWKIQRDVFLPGTSRALTNADVERMWRAEAAELARVRSPHVVATVPIPSRHHHSLPVTWCRRTGAWFHPPCPETGAYLTVIRDDEFLRECGLRAWSSSGMRYLYGGGERRTTRSFYRVPGTADERPRSGVRLRIGSQLQRDWSALVHGKEDLAARPAVAAFPCRTCRHRDECYPKGVAGDEPIPAEQQLVPLTFYDAWMLPLELQHLTYDDLCDLLGGAEWEAIRQQVDQPYAHGRLDVARTLDPAMQSPRQYLFRHDADRFVLEVLRLKLVAFAELCEGLRALHQQAGRPHLGLAPGNVLVRMGGGNRDLPARWLFRTALADLGSPLQVAPADASARDVPPMLEPGPEMRQSLYLSPLVEGGDSVSAPMSLVVRKREVEGGAVRLLLEAQGAAHGGLRLDSFAAGDVVRVMAGGGGGENWIWCRVTELAGQRVGLSAELTADHPCAGWEPPRKFDGNLTFLKNFGTPCDLYGLGMLLFRTLLVNDAQDMNQVEKVVGNCLQRVEVEHQSRGRMDERACRGLVESMLRKEGECFRMQSVLYRADERARVGSPPLSHLWQEALLLAFRLTTRVPGFSLATSHANGQDNPAAWVDRVLGQVTGFLRLLHVEMFAAADRDRAIAAACGDLLAEMRQQMLGAAGGPTGPQRPAAAPGGDA